jgi:hypothetical protein
MDCDDGSLESYPLAGCYLAVLNFQAVVPESQLIWKLERRDVKLGGG